MTIPGENWMTLDSSARRRCSRRVRDWLKARSAWVGKLACCGYCFGHWVAFGLVAIYRPRLFEAWWVLDYFLTALVIAWLAAFQWAALCWLTTKAGK